MGFDDKIGNVKYMTLREKLIVLRDKAGLSQMALADQLGISRQAVTRWESGDTVPSMDKLKALAKIYGVSLDWLCNDEADNNVNETAMSVADKETSTAGTSTRNRKKRKSQYIAIALIVGVTTLACIWIVTRAENNELSSTQFEDMEDENVDMPNQFANGFDFEWTE